MHKTFGNVTTFLSVGLFCNPADSAQKGKPTEGFLCMTPKVVADPHVAS